MSMPSWPIAKASPRSPCAATSATIFLPGLRITNYRRRAAIAFLVDTEARIVSIVGVYYGGQDYEAWFLPDTDD